MKRTMNKTKLRQAISNVKKAQKVVETRDNSFRDFMETVTPFDLENQKEADKFWGAMRGLREEVGCYSSPESEASKRACNEFVRQIAAGETKYLSWDDLFRFIATQRWLKKFYYQPLFNVATNRGDDSYGDLLDSLFLAGPEFYSAVKAGKLTNDRAMSDLVAQELWSHHSVIDIVLHGENYFNTRLKDSAIRYLMWYESGSSAGESETN